MSPDDIPPGESDGEGDACDVRPAPADALVQQLAERTAAAAAALLREQAAELVRLRAQAREDNR